MELLAEFDLQSGLAVMTSAQGSTRSPPPRPCPRHLRGDHTQDLILSITRPSTVGLRLHPRALARYVKFFWFDCAKQFTIVLHPGRGE